MSKIINKIKTYFANKLYDFVLKYSDKKLEYKEIKIKSFEPITIYSDYIVDNHDFVLYDFLHDHRYFKKTLINQMRNELMKFIKLTKTVDDKKDITIYKGELSVMSFERADLTPSTICVRSIKYD